MNDFTKDELIKMKNGLEYLPNSVSISKQYWELCEKVIRKIQSLIDNYCEHDKRVCSADDDGHMVVQCGHCDLVLWHEKD